MSTQNLSLPRPPVPKLLTYCLPWTEDLLSGFPPGSASLNRRPLLRNRGFGLRLLLGDLRGSLAGKLPPFPQTYHSYPPCHPTTYSPY